VADPGEVSLSDLDNAPTNLGVQVGAAPAPTYAELNDKFTLVSNENFSMKAEIDVLKKRVNTSTILDSLIEPYAGKAFWFMCIYCGIVGILLCLSGCTESKFSLPAEVLSLMVGSTAVTVIGLVGMVLTGIFVGARKSGN
jgi:hypothetical protein